MWFCSLPPILQILDLQDHEEYSDLRSGLDYDFDLKDNYWLRASEVRFACIP